MSSTTVGPAFELLESKLRRPMDRRVGIPRTGLVHRLTTSSKTPIVGIFAGAGYGKTTLLAQWADADPRPFAWVSLDQRDNDPVVLLTYIAAALDRVEPQPPAVFEALSTPGAGVETVLTPRLTMALSSRSSPLVLVLDDVHLLLNPAGLQAVATLILGLPEAFQIAIAGRAEPQLPLARLRAQGVLDIGPGELAFDAGEADDVLRGANVHLPKVDVLRLVGRTEGWPVGVYLAALSIRAGGGAPAAAGFAGDDRLVGDYLRQEVLGRLPGRMASFLIRTSVLDELCGPLCDAVLGQRASEQTLEAIARQNLLVVPLDRRQVWYRYHHLFHELLRAELGRREPELVPELQRRAARWYEGHGRAEAALDYAQAAGDTDYAAQLFASVSILAYNSGRLTTLRRWLEWFEQDGSIQRYPLVALLGAWVLTLVGEAERAARLAAAAEVEGAGRDELLADGVTPVRALAAQLRVMMCQRGVQRLDDDARLALELTPEVSSLRCMTLLFSGMASLLAGDDGAADADFADAIEIGPHMGAGDSVAAALAERSILAIARGDWAAAERFTQQARTFIREHRLDDYATSAIVYAVAARVAVHRGDLASARSDLGRTQRLREQLTHATPWLSVQVRLQLAHAYLALTDSAGARTVLREIERIIRWRPDLGVLRSQVDELKTKLESTRLVAAGSSSLTPAELRLLPFLPTHLTFREIGERRYITQHTVKAQAVSIYRKLGVSSRSDAVAKARALGLLEP
jgi:LuxR family maltose regulon positive regulatory protein